MLDLIRSLGLLRLALIMMAAVDAVLAPAPGTAISLDGWDMFTSLIAPAAAPLIAMGILFDVMMSRVRANDSSGAVRERFRKIMWIEILTVIILTVVWLPFFMAIGK
jgi:hypothetical protein